MCRRKRTEPDETYSYDYGDGLDEEETPRRHPSRWLFAGLAGVMVVVAVALFILLHEPLATRRTTVVREPMLAPTSQPTKAASEGQASVPASAQTASQAPAQASAQAAIVAPSSLASHYTYDPNGNLKTRTDANGAITTYEYDALDRLTAIRYPDNSSVTYTYDAAGRRASMTDSLGTTTYSYDIHDRLVSITDPNKHTLGYAYDPRGLLAQLVYPDGTAANYAWNEDGQLSTVEDQTGITRYQYDAGGRLAGRTLPNGVVTRYEYDAANRLTSIEHRGPDGGLLMGFRYEYNAVNNRTQVTRAEGNAAPQITRYEYDDLDRLVRVSYPEGEVVSYSYDALGNRTLQRSSVHGDTRYTYNTADRLIRAESPDDALTYRYDTNGNLVERKDGAGHAMQYGWDYENRLTKVVSGTTTVEFQYDGDGRRLAKIIDGEKTEYVQHGTVLPQVVQALTGKKATRASLGLQHLAESGADGTRFYLEDALGSVVGATDAAGEFMAATGTTSISAETIEYDAFGAMRSTSPLSILFGFTGEETDEETGLIFLRARYYDPRSGRFLSKDAFRGNLLNPGSRNGFVYVENVPTKYVDPLGLQKVQPGDIIVYRDNNFVQWLIGVLTPGGNAGHVAVVLPTVLPGGNLALLSARPGAGVVLDNSGSLSGQRYDVYRPRMSVDNAALSDYAQMVRANNSAHYDYTGLVGLNLTKSSRDPHIASRRDEYTCTSVVCGASAAGGNPLGDFGGAFSPITPNNVANSSALARSYSSSSDGPQSAGGIMLDKAASVLVDLSDIRGATYDPGLGQMVLIGRKDASLSLMDPDDLAVAIRAVYSGEDPGVTMVPMDPTMRDITQRVEYFGHTENTHFGLVMFEADRYLKSLAGGQDTLTGQPLSPNVPGFKPEIDLMTDLGVREVPWHRNWFVPGEVVLKRSEDGSSMIFDRATIKLESRFIKFGPDGNPQDVPGSSPVTDEFTRSVTEHYDELAAGKPELAELVRLAKIVGVVKWLHDNDIPVDLDWMNNYHIKPVETPKTTPGLVAHKNAPDGSYSITSMGGVGYDTPNTYDKDTDGRAAELGAAALASRPADMPIVWSFEQDGETLTAVALNLAPSEIVGGDLIERTDASVQAAGGQTIAFKRRSNSLAQATGPLGRSWAQAIQSLVVRRVAAPDNSKAFHTQAVLTYGSDRIEYNLTNDGLFRPADVTSAYLALGLTDADRFEPLAAPDLTMTPGLPGQPLEVRDGSGRSVQYTGLVALRKDGSRLAFDPFGRLDAIRDSAGNQVRYSYQDGRLVAIKDDAGRGIELAYDADGKLTDLTTSDGRAVRYVYDTFGNLAGTFDETGARLEGYAYDTDGRLLTIADSAGHIVQENSYDKLGRVIATQAAQGGSLSVRYDANTNTTTSTDSLGNTYVRRYDEHHRVVAEVGPEGATNAYEYDSQDHLTGMTDPNGNTTRLNYDAHGQLTEVLLPLGGKIRWLNYNELGVPEIIVDPLGRMTFLQYDAQGRIVGETSGLQMGNESADGSFSYSEADRTTSEYEYDSAGRLSAVKDPSGFVTRFAYDAVGNMTEVELPGGGKITQRFDSRSQLSAIADAFGSQARFDYDTHGRLTSVTTPSGVSRYEYTGEQLTSINDALGRTTRYEYHPAGLLAKVVDPIGGTTSLTYDSAGRLTSIKDAKDRSIAYSYDADSRLTGETIATGELTNAGVPERSLALSDALAGQIASQPSDAAEIKQQLAGLGTAQLESLEGLGGDGRRLYGQMLDQAELDFLEGAAAAMLPGTRPADFHVYGTGERRLVVYADDKTGVPGRAKTLEKLRRHYRLQRQVAGETVVSVATAGASLKVLAGDRFAEIAPHELETLGDRLERILKFWRPSVSAEKLALSNPELLGRLLQAKGLVSKNAGVIGFDGDLADLNFQEVFPNARVYRTQGTDVEAILQRRQRLSDLKIGLADIAIFNGIPDSETGVKNIDGKTKDTASWRDAHIKWRTTVEERGAAIAPASADALITALQSKPMVVVLIAHNDGVSIRLPDGSKFNVVSLTPEVRQAIAANAPVVWLFSCRTGSMKDGQSLAQGLLDAGATSVIAPYTDIDANENTVVLDRFLDGISQGKRILDAIDDALRTKIGKAFEIRIGRVPSNESPRPLALNRTFRMPESL